MAVHLLVRWSCSEKQRVFYKHIPRSDYTTGLWYQLTSGKNSQYILTFRLVSWYCWLVQIYSDWNRYCSTSFSRWHNGRAGLCWTGSIERTQLCICFHLLSLTSKVFLISNLALIRCEACLISELVLCCFPGWGPVEILTSQFHQQVTPWKAVMKGGQCANVETNALRLCCSEHIYIQFELSTQATLTVVFTFCLYLHLVFSRHVGIARFRKKKKKKKRT